MNFSPPSDIFSAALTAALDYAPYGGADIAECLQAVEQIRGGDRESWHLAWMALAERVRRRASGDLAGGRQTEARDAFLRAAHYYRTSSRFLETPGDPRSATTREASGACFLRAMRLSTPAGAAPEIEHEGAARRAHFHRADDAPYPRPALLVVGEADAPPLELYFSCAVAANRCGWHCLALPVSAPGDASAAAGSLLTSAFSHASVDTERLALLVFREEPASRGDMRCHRLALPLAMGNAATIQDALRLRPGAASPAGLSARNGPDVFHAAGSLGSFHQQLFRWLDRPDALPLTENA